MLDLELKQTMNLIGTKQAKDFVLGSDRVLRFKGTVCILDDI